MGWSTLDWPFGCRAPFWPRGGGVREPPRRWKRRPERWEEEGESFDGRTVLDDLVLCAGDRVAAARVVARYAAVRLVLRAAAGDARGPALDDERAAAWEFVVEVGPPGSRDREVLAAVVALAGPSPGPALATAMVAAGDAAWSVGEGGGAFALYRTAYRLGVERGWWAEAARAAAALAALAEEGGGHWSVKRWRRRSAVLARRAEARGR